MPSTSSDRQRPRPRRPGGTNPPRTGSPIIGIHPENGLAEPFNPVSSPPISGDGQGPAPTGVVDAFNRYQRLIYYILTEDYAHISSNDIEDVISTVWVEICQSWGTKREWNERATEAWIRRIIQRVVFDYRWESSRWPLTGFAHELFESIQASSGGEGALVELIAEERLERLAEAIRRLPKKLRQVVELRLEAATVEEIARALGCCARTVTIRQRKAIEALEAELAPNA
jgi:RNA polymerase sigma factor (sigma-70 family)